MGASTEYAQLARMLEGPSLPKATATDRCPHFATTDSLPLPDLLPQDSLALQVATIVSHRQLQPSPAAAGDVFHQAECPSLPSACFADRAAGPSCPAKSALSTCRWCSYVGAASVSRQARCTRAFRAHHAKRRHPYGHFPARCSTVPLPRPFPRHLRCWGCDSPRSRLISLAHHDTRSAGPSCPELRPAR